MTRSPRPLLLALCFAVQTAALAQTPLDPAATDRFYKDNNKFKFSFPATKSGGEIAWSYRKLEMIPDEYAILEGEVKITWQDVVFRADKITYNLKTKDATGEGHVIIDQGPQRLTADHVVFNITTKTGTFFNATANFEPAIYFAGDKIEKLDDKTYRLTNGVFTSCDLERPAWSFRLRSAEVTVDDYARFHDVSFRAWKLPLLWTPYIIFPTKKDRARGFLVPKVGYSSRYGGSLQSAYFLPMGVSADTTIYADLFTDGFAGAGLTFRYAPSPDITSGKLDLYAVKDPAEGGSTEWKYRYSHAQDHLFGDFRGVVEVRDFSNLSFFRDFERSFALSTISQINSSAYLTKNRPTYSLNLRADRKELVPGVRPEDCARAGGDLDNGECRVRFEQLPAVEFKVYPNRLASTPLYFSMESSAGHLQNSGGANYERVDLSPVLALKLKTPSWISVRPQLSLRGTRYSASNDPVSQRPDGPTIDRSYGQGEVEIVGPSLSRIYSRALGGFTKFKHVVEPRARYLHTTTVTNQDRVIQFDTVDSPFLPLVRDVVEYSLTQRIIAKEKGENPSAREIMTLSLKQSVSLAGPFQSGFGGTDKSRFTPLTLSAHFNPYQAISIDANTTFGNLSRQLDQSSVSASLTKKQAYLYLTWFASYRSPQVRSESSQIRIVTGAPLIRRSGIDRLRADLHVNFDADKGKPIEQRLILGTNASCYSVALEYRDFRYGRFPGGAGEKRNQDFQLSISLRNVGTFVDLSLDSLFSGSR